MADARTEAIEAMSAEALRRGRIGTAFDHYGRLLDAIPTAALVRLVIERGGLEERDELRVISMKRGSRRWLPPRPA